MRFRVEVLIEAADLADAVRLAGNVGTVLGATLSPSGVEGWGQNTVPLPEGAEVHKQVPEGAGPESVHGKAVT